MPNEITLKRKKTEVLKVNIDGKSYSIPLGTSLGYKELAKLNNQDEIMKFFEKHLGEEVMDTLSLDDLKQIIEAWANATKEQSSGTSLGES